MKDQKSQKGADDIIFKRKIYQQHLYCKLEKTCSSSPRRKYLLVSLAM